MIPYNDPFVVKLDEDIRYLLEHEDREKIADVRARLEALGQSNCPSLTRYWHKTQIGFGVPDRAFKGDSPYYFPDAPPVKVFSTSGTSGAKPGRCYYSARGLSLMEAGILKAASKNLIQDLEKPAIIRLLPSEQTAPEMIMAYGMELIARTFGAEQLSQSVVTERGFDRDLLVKLLHQAQAEERPVILIGGSFACVNAMDALQQDKIKFQLPLGSRMVDAGGFKGRSREVAVPVLHQLAQDVFGIAPERCINIFGMTELASQLYDTSTYNVGPLGERPKAGRATVVPLVRDSLTLEPISEGLGLLEIADLCVLDRPYSILTGDLAIQRTEGVAIVGRAQQGEVRGCSLNLEVMSSHYSGV